MPAKIHREQAYGVDVETVFAAMTDRAFIEEKYAAIGHTGLQILENEPTDDGGHRTVTERQAEAQGIPDIAKKVFGSKQTIKQTEVWGPAAADGSRTSTWTVETKGAPASLKGGSTIKPDGDGSLLTIDGELKVSVPLIGGKIEGSLRPVLEEQIKAEMDFGVEWSKR